MKKLTMLLILGMLSVPVLQAQRVNYASLQSVSDHTLLFGFDSLNVSYEGSWGFGQSFSISSDTSGNIVFIGSGAGVIILDVTNPAAPVKLSEISARGLVDAICYDEAAQRLYLCAYFAGFEIWDVSDLTAPVKLGGGVTNGLPRGGIFSNGNYVYVVTVADGVQVFDVSSPSAPVNTGNCPLSTSNFAWNSAKQGDLIFAALGNGGLKVVDVSDPSDPHVEGTYSSVVTGVFVADDYAYVASYNFGLRILDISNLSAITQVGSCAITGYPSRVQVIGDYAYIGNATTNPGGGINVVNISTPSDPQLITTYDGYADFITAHGSVLAYTGSNFPCTILDLTDPAAPTLASSYTLPVMTIDVEVNGNYAYTGNNGFRVFDITDQARPVQVGYDATDGAIVRLAGDKAVYIRESMSANNPVMIMDVSDPALPGFVGQYMSPVMTNDLEVRDHYAFVACWWDGLRVVDFQDPGTPVLVAHKMGWFQNAVPGVDFCYVQALDIDGNYIYLMDYGPFSGEDTRGLYILDITDPENPVFVSRFTDFTSGGYDIDAVGNFVYVADMYGGLEVIDVTDKLAPVARGYVSLPDVANSVKVSENQAFVAAYINGGVQAVDVTDPDSPVVDGYYAPSGCFALGVNVQGNDIFLADGAGGFQIYSTTLITGIDEKENPSEASSFASPNPFADRVIISVQAQEDANHGLFIFDVSGRQVATLSPERESSGSVVFEWDGKTDAGTEAKPGLYYYRTGSGAASGKVVKH